MSPADAAQAGCLPRKSFDVEFKDLAEGDPAGEFELYAAVFGNIDRQGDVINPGAFRNLDSFVKDGWIASNHDMHALPVAYPTAASQDAHGLLIRGRFHGTEEAQAVRTVVKERMAAGKAVKTSIGYLSMDETYEKQAGQTIRRLNSIDIYEASFVNLPANPLAEVTLVKSMDDKSGRVISRANYTRLRDLADQLTQHAATITEFLKPHDPDAPAGDEGKSDDAAESRRVELRRRAVQGRRIRSCP